MKTFEISPFDRYDNRYSQPCFGEVIGIWKWSGDFDLGTWSAFWEPSKHPSVVAKFSVTKNGTEGARIKNSETSLSRGHRPTVLWVFNNIALQLLFHCPICFRRPYVLASEPTFSGFNPFFGAERVVRVNCASNLLPSPPLVTVAPPKGLPGDGFMVGKGLWPVTLCSEDLSSL